MSAFPDGAGENNRTDLDQAGEKAENSSSGTGDSSEKNGFDTGSRLKSGSTVGDDQFCNSSIENETESELIRRASEGDHIAFGVVFKRKRARIYRLAARICGPNEAEDVTQIVFLRLWKMLPTLKAKDNMDAWLTRTTVNRSIDVLRHIGRRLNLIVSEKQASPGYTMHQPLERGEISIVFNKAAHRLGDRQRVAFVLREMEGFSTDEVANLMGITASTVRNLVRQSRIGLRKAMRNLYPEYVPAEAAEEKGAENE